MGFFRGFRFALITIVYRAVPSLLLYSELQCAIDAMAIGWGLLPFAWPTGLSGGLPQPSTPS